MRAKVKAVYLGSLCNDFKDKQTGEVISYRKAQFDVRGAMETFQLSVPKDLDCACLKEYQDAFLLVDFRYDDKFKNFKGRLVNVYPTEKAWLEASGLTQAEEREAAMSEHHV